MKKILSIIFSALLICSATACSAGNDSFVSVIDSNSNSSYFDDASSDENVSVDTDSSSDIDIENLPSKVDLRNYNGKNYVTPVKSQAFGDCWSFGISAAAESSYLYSNDHGISASETNDEGLYKDNFNVNFSERYLSWYVYHGITQDDVTLGKVRASQVGEGYDTTATDSFNSNSAFLMGGALLSGMNIFASGFGPVDETTEVNGKYPYAYSDKNIVNNDDFEDFSSRGDWSIPLNSQYRNAPIKAFLRNGNLLPCPASKDSDGNYIFNEDGVRAIKTEIAQGHAVAITALVFGRMNQENWAAYTTIDERNHVVTIVGYDDNYPKENFEKLDKDGNIDPDSIPPTDGAFIIKDSSGEYGGFDRKGTFYISYHDHTLLDPISFDFDKPDSVKYSDVNYDQYDLLFIGWCASADYDSETKMANVFDAEMDEYLTQITYRTTQFNTDVHYAIYKDISEDCPDSGTLLEEGDRSHWFAGSHKIDLKGEYSLSKGEKYSVVLTMSYTADDGNTTYTNVIPYATNVIPYGASKNDETKAIGIINKSESYLFNNGKWTDLTEFKDDFAKIALELDNTRSSPDSFKALSIDRITIDNFPIKAILVPADKHK